jgi:alkaline phosphatase D
MPTLSLCPLVAVRLAWLLAIASICLLTSGLGPGSVVLGQTVGEDPAITHGVAAGDVTDHSAVIWARSNMPSQLVVAYALDGSGDDFAERAGGKAEEIGDFTAIDRLDGLQPGSRYRYRAWFQTDDAAGQPKRSEPVEGTFRTAPAVDSRSPVHFQFGGDVGGTDYCRPERGGYALFGQMAALEPDFVIGAGDMIYAAATCGPVHARGFPEVPGDFLSIKDPAVDWTNERQVREVFDAHWRYNLADSQVQRLYGRTALYQQWDDGDLGFDWGNGWPYRGQESRSQDSFESVLRIGRERFIAYSPMAPFPDEPLRLYRSFRWGRDIELFIVDTRSYRSWKDLLDTPENAKTMIGREQLAWLEKGLRSSNATWKIVSWCVPLSVGSDTWTSGSGNVDPSTTTGYRRELGAFFRFLDDQNLTNVVVVTGDTHQPTFFRYELDANGDGDEVVVHELMAGPFASGSGKSQLWLYDLDPTFKPRVLYGEGGFNNFGHAWTEMNADGLPHLRAEIRGPDGKPRPGSTIDLTPR